MLRTLFAIFFLFCVPSIGGMAQERAGTSTEQDGKTAGWPAPVRAIEYRSEADQSLQPALFYDPGGNHPKPLLVALHSWSGDYRQANPAYGIWCIAKGWVLIHPNFRGVNDHPEACGSELVVKDILSAVDFAKKKSSIDEQRIYLIGASGGGYCSLLMAGRSPEVWAGVSAWCPILDLKAWHGETALRKLRYASMLEKVCGGKPGETPAIDEQYRLRSASTWLSNAKGVPSPSTPASQTDITGASRSGIRCEPSTLLPSKRIGSVRKQSQRWKQAPRCPWTCCKRSRIRFTFASRPSSASIRLPLRSPSSKVDMTSCSRQG